MKGIVFTAFNDMVEQQIGIEVWDDILDAVKPESRGIYTSVEDFPDSELFELVAELSAKTGTPQIKLVRAFGHYLFHVLSARHPLFTSRSPDFFTFLKNVEDVIHKEVYKLYPNPNLPSLKWEQPDPDTLVLNYSSPRRLCQLATGLIKGAAEQYNVQYELEHSPCMHEGADSCRFTIRLI